MEREIANIVFNIIFNDAGGRGPRIENVKRKIKCTTDYLYANVLNHSFTSFLNIFIRKQTQLIENISHYIRGLHFLIRGI